MRTTDWYQREYKRKHCWPFIRWEDPLMETVGPLGKRTAEDREMWKLSFALSRYKMCLEHSISSPQNEWASQFRVVKIQHPLCYNC